MAASTKTFRQAVGLGLAGALLAGLLVATPDAARASTEDPVNASFSLSVEFSGAYTSAAGLNLTSLTPDISLYGALPLIGETNPRFDYEVKDSSEAVIYEDSAELTSDDYDTRGSSALPEGLLQAGATYSFSSQVVTDQQTRPRSTPTTLIARGTPEAAPLLVAPAANAVITASPTLQVSLPHPETLPWAVSLVLESNWEEGNPEVEVATVVVPDPDGSVYLPLRLAEGHYRWKALTLRWGAESEWSEYSEFTYEKALTAPTNLQVQQYPGSTRVSFVPPRSASGLPVTTTVSLAPGGASVSTTTSSVEFEGLAPGTYSVAATASTTLGTSPTTTVAYEVLPTVSSRPENVTSEGTVPGQMNIKWEQPETDGFAAVQSYTVTAVGSYSGEVFASQTVSATTTQALLTGLPQSEYLRFDVVAVNAQGESGAGSAWAFVPALHTAASDVSIRPGDGRAYLAWTEAGGSPRGAVGGYKITLSPGNLTFSLGLEDIPLDPWGDHRMVLEGLTNGTEYTATITPTAGEIEGDSATSPPTTPGAESVDTDQDGLGDIVEQTVGSNPELPDSDGDQLTDFEELTYLPATTELLVPDSDGDGTSDADEDSDSDGITNRLEITSGTDPTDADTDLDGVTDLDEGTLGTSPTMADTDDDGLQDGFEQDSGLNPLLEDSDADGVADSATEVSLSLSAQLTSFFDEYGDPISIPSPTATTTGLASRAAKADLQAHAANTVPGIRTAAAVVSLAEDTPSDVVTARARTATSAFTADISFPEFDLFGDSDLNFSAITYSETTKSWNLAGNDLSFSTADRTVTVHAVATGTQFAVVDLRAWRANATQCASAQMDEAPLDVTVVLDGTTSVALADPGENRFAALRAVLTTLSSQDHVYFQIPSIQTDDTGVARMLPVGGAGLWGSSYSGAHGYLAYSGVPVWEALAVIDAMEEQAEPINPQDLWFGPQTDDDRYPREYFVGGLSDRPVGEILFGSYQRDHDLVSNPYVDDAPSFACRNETTVLVTDGDMVPDLNAVQNNDGTWEGYDEGYIPFVERDTPVHVLDVGVTDGSATWLRDLATGTGGTYSYVPSNPDVSSWIATARHTEETENYEEQIALDSDSDGLNDYVELHGITNAWGNKARYFTDPHRADTDEDGLPDGDEVGAPIGDAELDGWAAPTPITAYAVVSDPGRTDGDRDGVSDPEENELGFNALDPDMDRDGLTDGEEALEGTYPDRSDSDFDNFSDSFEAEDETGAYDPLVYTERIKSGQALEDFLIGMFCGDFDVCQRSSGPWLAGSILSGFLVYGDVRDVFINLYKGDTVAFGMIAIGFAPGGGDIASAAGKVIRAAKKSLAEGRDVRAGLKTLQGLSDKPKQFFSYMREVDPRLMDLIEAQKLSDGAAIRLITSNGPLHLRMLLDDSLVKVTTTYAGKVPGFFRTGDAGERYLQDELFNVSGYKKYCVKVPSILNWVAACRFADAEVTDELGKLTAIESKVGLSRGPFAARQIDRDAWRLETGSADEIEWHFFASDVSGRIGMDRTIFEKLRAAGITVVVHLPRA